MIGKRFRTGVDLSGGEWQKIAIARAYMRDAQLLILDEPTAALDARAEFEVFQRFKELSEGKTAVLISHRFSSVRMADRILVLAEGEIEAAGTHEELLAAGGRYAELFELQAAGYRSGRLFPGRVAPGLDHDRSCRSRLDRHETTCRIGRCQQGSEPLNGICENNSFQNENDHEMRPSSLSYGQRCAR